MFGANIYLYNKIEWHLKDEDKRPQLEIERKNYTDQSGTFTYGIDGFAKVSCKMKFIKFPFDVSKCKYMVSSTLYTAEVKDQKCLKDGIFLFCSKKIFESIDHIFIEISGI